MSTNDHKRDRREPTLGDLDHLDAPAPRTEGDELPRIKDTELPRAEDDALPRIKADVEGRRPAPPHRSHPPRHRTSPPLRSWLWPLLAIVIVILLALAWINQDKLRGMLPRTHLTATLVQANKALAAGHLEGGNGTSAHALYAKVLKQEPDNVQALKGLHEVGEAELARASSAIRADNYQKAAVSLANARRVLGGGTDVDQVAKALQKARHPATRIHDTIEKAQQALAAGQVAGPHGAAALYHQVLRVDPHNVVARHGLTRAGGVLATQARQAISQGGIATAESLIDELGQWVPHDGDLPSLRAHLAQAKQAAGAAITTHLAKGQSDLHQGHFTGHNGDNALSEFQAVLKLDPGNAQARAGLNQVAQALILRANAAIDGGDADQARALLDQAAKLAPKSAELAAARARLGPATVQIASAGSVTHPALTPLQQVEIKHLVLRAKSAVDSGHIMLPPGASAYDLYRQALAIDGNNAAALAGLHALPGKVVRMFNQALAAHHLTKAGGYLAALKSLEPGGGKTNTLGQRLGDAWLHRAQNDLDQGNHVAAKRALDAARKLNPDSARVKALRKKIHDD